MTPTELPGLRWVSDRALRVDFGEGISRERSDRVRVAVEAIRKGVPGSIEVTPAYATVLVTIDPLRGDPDGLEGELRRVLRECSGSAPAPGRTIEIPVCYDRELALDLEDVARLTRLDPSEVVARHAATEYELHFLGFAPGFPYLGGLDPALSTPRLDRPRTRVPAGSVAIGGAQTGVYPRSMPGGWRIVGRTPLTLFDPDREPPSLLAAGDRVRFVPIGRDRFDAMSRGVA